MICRCVLLALAALSAAPAARAQSSTLDQTTYAESVSGRNYQLKVAEIQLLETLSQQVPCSTMQVFHQFFFFLFMGYEKGNMTVSKEVFVDIVTVQQNAVNSSMQDGFTVSIFVSPYSVVSISLEYKGLFSQVIMTPTTIILFFSFSTVDNCTCASISYDATYVATAQDYNDGYDNYDYGCDGTATERVCSVCGGYASPEPPCNATTPPPTAPPPCNCSCPYQS